MKNDHAEINALNTASLKYNAPTEFKRPRSSVAPFAETIRTSERHGTNLCLASPSMTEYQFPIGTMEEYAPTDISAQALRWELLRLTIEIDRHGCYEVFREEFCAINMQLNLMRTLAPRFRAYPTADIAKPDIARLIGLDLQVIDLHWCAHTDFSSTRLPKFFFKENKFCSERASRFVTTSLSVAENAALLNLTETMQWQCALLQSIELKEKWGRILYGSVQPTFRSLGIAQVEHAISEAIPGIGCVHAADMAAALMARQIAGPYILKTTWFLSLILGCGRRSPHSVARSILRAEKRLLKAGVTIDSDGRCVESNKG